MSTNLIHQTDLFHPHGDPDDHYDLATVYVLAAEGRFDLGAVLLDFPHARRRGDSGVIPMAQLSHLTGVTGVPFSIGSRNPLRSPTDKMEDREPRDRASAEWICKFLEASPTPVTFNLVGSSTNVALAALLRPDLFAEKVAAVYINSGAAHEATPGQLEFNVRLDPSGYSVLFSLPCPIYWSPCWHTTEAREVCENGTWWPFVQGELFPTLSEPLQRYFHYMLEQSADPQYLRLLDQPLEPEAFAEYGEKRRSMWSTAAILHAAGLGVDVEKGLQPLEEITDPVYEYRPVQVSCDEQGRTTWEWTEAPTNRRLIHILRLDLYPVAMFEAMRKVLQRV